MNKHCKFCGQDKPLEEFAVHPAGKHGRHSKCKACTRRMHHEKRAERLGSRRAKRAEHPEVARERGRIYYRNNRHIFLRNMQQQRAQKTDWRSRNPDRARELAREHDRARRRAHPHIFKLRDTARKLRQRANGALRSHQLQALWEAQAGKCRWCKKALALSEACLDHIISVSRGGDNRVSNLCWACRDCNQRKYNKMPHEFAGVLF